MTEFTRAGRRVRALRHGMAGQPGFELFGPWQDAEAVRKALLAAGAQDELLPAGSLGGCFHSDEITDYYTTPCDLGYGAIVAFDHELPGRVALEQLAANPPRQKVSLI